MALNERQKRFVAEYLIDLNATAAAKRAEYSERTAYSMGQRLLKNVEIQEAIQKAIEKRAHRTEITQDMPYRTGATIKLTQTQTVVNEPRIITAAPHAKYIYFGKVMVGDPPKQVTDQDLQYTKTKNPQAGPYWDRALVAAEGTAMRNDLQRYVNRKAGKS